MEYRTIANTDVKVSAVSLGCWTLGGLEYNQGRMIGWHPVDEQEAVDAIQYAVDQGVNHFDNADVYGSGRAERMLGRALEGVSKDVLVSSKVGFFLGTAAHAYEPHHIRAQCEQSLINLRRDAIDIYYLHNTNFGENGRYLDGAAEILHRLKEEGKVRLVGLSGGPSNLVKYVPRVKPDVLQTRATMMDRKALDPGTAFRKMCEKRRLQVVCFSPFEQGLLLAKYSSENPPKFERGDVRRGKARFSRKGLAEIEPKIEKLKERFGSRNEDLAAACLGFLLAHEHVLSPIPGFRNLAQVRSNLDAGGRPMDEDGVKFVRDLFA